MIAVLLIAHIVLMVTSVGSTVGLTVAAAFGRNTSKQLLNASYLVTALGVLTGGLLLLSHPLDMKCIVLICYVLAFVAVHRLYIFKNIKLTA